ncbi:MAG: type II toxin-antitoxin system HicA family toxin [Terriglobia bacterium]
MKLPRDLDGRKLASLLHRYGYQITRQTGSHIRLTSTARGAEHHVTVPAYKEIRVGTLHAILRDVAVYLDIEEAQLLDELFGG